MQANLNKTHWIAILIFTLIFAFLYFGLDTKSKKQKGLEKSRAEKIELIDIDRYIRKKKESLSPPAASYIMNVETEISESSADDQRIELFKQLASKWYSIGSPLISAFYAEQVAKLSGDEKSWSITGTSYTIAAQNSDDEREKQYAIQKSRTALDKAIALDEANIDNQINLALTYVEVQDQENPMKGIMMLLDLNKKNPEDASVLFQLGRLSLGTNQLDNAVKRLSQAVELKNDYTAAYCLLARAYEKLGQKSKADEAQKNCDTK